MSTATDATGWRAALRADATGVLLVVLVVAGLHGALALHAGSSLGLTQFAATHGWAFDRMARMLSGAEPWSAYTDEVSFPARLYAAHIAWVPGLLAAPFNWISGPVLGLNVATLVSPAIAVPVVSALARGWAGAPPWRAAAAGAIFALSPPALGAFANGQVCKAQLWALALVPLAVLLAARSWRWLLAVPLLGAAVVFTEPTYALIGALVVPGAVVLGARSGNTGRAFSPVAAARASLAAIALAGVFVVARGYYQGEVGGLYVPAAAVRLAWFDHYVLQVATPWSLLFGRAYAVQSDLAVHVDYLGVVGLGAVAVACARRTRGAAWALALVVLGAVLGLGEWLVTLDAPVRVDGRAVALPARGLAALGFPLAHSGQYYRFLGLAWLGVVLATSSLSPRLSAALLAALWLDGLRATATLWPVSSAHFDGLRCFTPLPEGVSGWRLDLPRKRTLADTGLRDLATAVDGVPTTDPPAAWATEHPANRLVPALGHMGSLALTERLREEGVVRVVAWNGGLEGDAASIADALTAPTCTDGEVRVWDVYRR